MKYYVGDVAKLLGITPSALRFYEDKKIICTKKTDSGRRYYTQADIARLLSMKKYSSMGISLKYIEGQFALQGDSRHVIEARVREKALEAERKAEYYRHLSGVIEGYAGKIKDIDNLTGHFETCLRPELYLLSDPQSHLISTDQKIMDVMRQWVQGMPTVRYVFFQRKEQFDDFSNISLGYTISAAHAAAIDLPVLLPFAEHLPESVCLRTIVELDNAFDRQAEIFSSIFDYLDKKQVKPSGVSIALIIVVENIASDCLKHYLDVTTPFQL